MKAKILNECLGLISKRVLYSSHGLGPVITSLLKKECIYTYTKAKLLSNTCEMFVASLTRRFVSAKRLFRDLLGFKGKLVEHRAPGLWARCSTSLPLNSKRSLKSLLAETKRRVRLATNISQVFDNSFAFV